MVVALLCLILIFPGSFGPQAVRVELNSQAGRKLSFVVPEGFRPLTREEIALKFTGGNPPTYAYTNDALPASIAVTFSPGNLPPDRLPDFKEVMTESLPTLMPGLKWVEQDIVGINGVQWVHFKFTTPATDTETVNDLYATSFEGKALLVGYASPANRYEKAKPLLEASKNSLRVKK